MTSQNGECLVLDGILMVLNVPHTCLEIGVTEPGGKAQCNTVHLIDRGWRGWLIDEDQLSHPAAVKARVTVENLPDLLQHLSVPDDLGVLSIDVDGNDYWLWKAWPGRPAVVVIEYNADVTGSKVIPYNPDHRHDWSPWFGASAGAMVKLAHKRGYRLVGDVAHVNLFFVRDDLLPADHAEPPLESLQGRTGQTDPRPYQEV